MKSIKHRAITNDGKHENFLGKNIIQICSVLIATMALAFTVWQGNQTRKFYKLTVTPKLMVEYLNYPNEHSFEISIKNNGVGPAIIDELKIIDMTKKTEYRASKLQGNLWYKIFQARKIEDSLVNKYLSHFYISPDNYISAKEGFQIFKIYGVGLSNNAYLKLMQMVASFKIIVEYHSVYEDKYMDSLFFEGIKVVTYN